MGGGVDTETETQTFCLFVCLLFFWILWERKEGREGKCLSEGKGITPVWCWYFE